MKPTPDIVAERPLARHAEALIKPREAAPDVAVTAREFGVALGKRLRDPLGALLGGAQLAVSCGEAEACEARVVFSRYKPPAAHFQLNGVPGMSGLFISLSRNDVLAICDRAFGGTGAIQENDSGTGDLPYSADLILARLGKLLTGVLGDLTGQGEAIAIARRGENLERLAPFNFQAETLSLSLTIAEEGQEGWQINFMGLAAGFTAFLGALDGVDPAETAETIPLGPDDEPFCDIPLPLRAVLADMRVPVSRLSALAPGDILPLSLRREVPLLAQGTELARGTIGTMDDRVALKLTTITCAKGHFQ